MFKWGIIGTGKIASRFAEDLGYVRGASLAGVTSRNQEGVAKFATKWGATAYASADTLLKSNIDAVYIATPHTSHMKYTVTALEQGVPVLCEKPFAMNLSEAKHMVELAKEKNVFLMEAMWTRFIPAIRDIIKRIHAGELGQIERLEANFGYNSPRISSSRIFNINLGGGSLLDVGVYCVALAQMIFNEAPLNIKSETRIGETEIDEESLWTSIYSTGAVATGLSSIISETKKDALIQGTKGTIRIPQFWHAKEYYLNDVVQKFDCAGHGLHFEAQEVMDCLKQGRKESALLPLQQSLAIMHTLDEIQKPWGLRYPMTLEKTGGESGI